METKLPREGSKTKTGGEAKSGRSRKLKPLMKQSQGGPGN